MRPAFEFSRLFSKVLISNYIALMWSLFIPLGVFFAMERH